MATKTKSISVKKAPSIKATAKAAPAPAPEVSVEATAAAPAEEAKAKRKYNVIGRDAVKARREQVAAAAKDFLASHGKPARQAEIFRAVCASTGFGQTPSVWNDLSKALEALTKAEAASLDKQDKKRGTYSLKA